MSQFGLPSGQHRRTESRELQLVMDLVWADRPEPCTTRFPVLNGSSEAAMAGVAPAGQALPNARPASIHHPSRSISSRPGPSDSLNNQSQSADPLSDFSRNSHLRHNSVNEKFLDAVENLEDPRVRKRSLSVFPAFYNEPQNLNHPNLPGFEVTEPSGLNELDLSETSFVNPQHFLRRSSSNSSLISVSSIEELGSPRYYTTTNRSVSNRSSVDFPPLTKQIRHPSQDLRYESLNDLLPPQQRQPPTYLSMPQPTQAAPASTSASSAAVAVPGASSVERTPSPEADIHMSMVSPPFTPSASQVDLATKSPKTGAEAVKGAPMEPLSLDSKQVRRKLDETLPTVFCESRARIPTTNGEEIFLHVYSNDIDTKEHLAIVFGSDIHSKTLFAPRAGETEHDRMTRGAYTGKLYPGRMTSTRETEKQSESTSDKGAFETAESAVEQSSAAPDVLCRIHSECYTGETAWSARCDCGEQLDEAARLMAREGRGVIVYLRQEGRGIGLGEKLKAYNLQDLGADTVQANLMLRHPADGRSFGLATAILKDLGLDQIRLMTNNPDKIVAVEGRHKEITVTQRVPMIPLSWQKKGGFQSTEVDKYLSTKIERMGHLLER